MSSHSTKVAPKRGRSFPSESKQRPEQTKELTPDAVAEIDERDAAYLCLDAPLTSGCYVALVNDFTNKRPPRLGLYWPGPPAEFAEMVDYMDNGPNPQVRKRGPIPACARPFLWVSTRRKYR
jgi:hypothetical protein